LHGDCDDPIVYRCSGLPCQFQHQPRQSHDARLDRNLQKVARPLTRPPGPWYIRLAYLIPGAACLLLTLVAFKWPRLGGWLIILIGSALTVWWSNGELRRLIQLFPVSGVLVVIGVLFLLEGRHRRRLRESGPIAGALLTRKPRFGRPISHRSTTGQLKNTLQNGPITSGTTER